MKLENRIAKEKSLQDSIRKSWYVKKNGGDLMDKDPFKEYIKQSEPSKRDKGYAWHTAIGLQAVDGLKSTRASELIKMLVDSEVIVQVTGHGKGKYRFQL